MLRKIGHERRVRAVAAVHGLVGAGAIVGAIAWALFFSGHSHGLDGLVVPMLAGSLIVAGSVCLGFAYLLWTFHPLGRWSFAAVLAGVSATMVYFFAHYDLERLSGRFHEVAKPALIEGILVLWSALVLAVLWWPGAGAVFSMPYRQAAKGDHEESTHVYVSPLFWVGVVLWSVVAWAWCTLSS